MTDFNWYLNRQGLTGHKGDKGDQGYSPYFTVETSTANVYKLRVHNEKDSFVTDNLRGNVIKIVNPDGTYIKYDKVTGDFYVDTADIASTDIVGQVRLATLQDVEVLSNDTAITPELLADTLPIYLVNTDGNISIAQRDEDSKTVINLSDSFSEHLSQDFVTVNTDQTITGIKYIDGLRTTHNYGYISTGNFGHDANWTVRLRNTSSNPDFPVIDGILNTNNQDIIVNSYTGQVELNSDIKNKINNVISDLATEKTTRLNADNQLLAQINAERSERETQDSALQSALSSKLDIDNITSSSSNIVLRKSGNNIRIDTENLTTVNTNQIITGRKTFDSITTFNNRLILPSGYIDKSGDILQINNSNKGVKIDSLSISEDSTFDSINLSATGSKDILIDGLSYRNQNYEKSYYTRPEYLYSSDNSIEIDVKNQGTYIDLKAKVGSVDVPTLYEGDNITFTKLTSTKYIPSKNDVSQYLSLVSKEEFLNSTKLNRISVKLNDSFYGAEYICIGGLPQSVTLILDGVKMDGLKSAYAINGDTRTQLSVSYSINNTRAAINLGTHYNEVIEINGEYVKIESISFNSSLNLTIRDEDSLVINSTGGGSSYTLPIASANTLGGIKGGNWLTVNQTTGKLECGELSYSQYQSALGYTFISKTTLENRLANLPTGGAEIDDEHVSTSKVFSSSKTSDLVGEVGNELQDLTQRVNNIESLKVPNVVIVGEPLIQDGQVSGLDQTNHLQFPFILERQGRSWEYNGSFTTGSNITNQQNIIDSKCSIALAVRNSKLIIALSSNGTTFNLGEHTLTDLTIQPNTTYYVKVSYIDNMGYVLEADVAPITYGSPHLSIGYANTPIAATTMLIGSDGNSFSGTIDLNKWSLKVDDQLVWLGMDNVGQAVSANVSLSNINEAGKEVIREVSGVGDIEEALNLLNGGDSTLLDSKQNKLVAGEGIMIDPNTNVISATGGGSGSGDMTTDTEQDVTGAKTFIGQTFKLGNSNGETRKIYLSETPIGTKTGYSTSNTYIDSEGLIVGTFGRAHVTFDGGFRMYYSPVLDMESVKAGDNITITQDETDGSITISSTGGSSDTELNNPYSLLDSKYSDHELNNISWLRSQGQWNSGTVYVDVYNLLLRVYNGSETIEGLSIKKSTESYTDYDFVINTSNTTFRLPLKTKLASGKLKGTLPVLTAPMHTFTDDVYKDYNELTFVRDDGETTLTNHQRLTLASSCNLRCVTESGTYNQTSFTPDNLYVNLDNADTEDLYLYYYVGETVQNANLIDAGRIVENFATKSMVDGQWVGKVADLPTRTTIGSSDIDLSDYLPNDNYNYEVMFAVNCSRSGSSNAYIHFKSSIIDDIVVLTTSSNAYDQSCVVTFPIGTNRIFTVEITSNNLSSFSKLQANGYRRIGTNV